MKIFNMENFWKAAIVGGWLLAILILLTGCSTFESFSFRLSQEVAYGDTAVNAEGAAAIANIEADKEVMMQSNKPHTVNVQFPGEMQPATDIPIEEAPPVLAPGASGMATMNNGDTLFDCVDGKGETVVCSRFPAQ